MTQYIVTRMPCAAYNFCAEKVVSKVPRARSCSVSLLTNSMGVEKTAIDADIIYKICIVYELMRCGFCASYVGVRWNCKEDGSMIYFFMDYCRILCFDEKRTLYGNREKCIGR